MNEIKIMSKETNKIYNNLYDMYLNEASFFEIVTLEKFNRYNPKNPPMIKENEFYQVVNKHNPRIKKMYNLSNFEYTQIVKSILFSNGSIFEIVKRTLNFKDTYECMKMSSYNDGDCNYTYGNKIIKAKSKIKKLLENIDKINSIDDFLKYA